MKLTFFGGANEVTGANYLLESGDGNKKTKILIDCGLKQGGYFAEKKNWDPLAYDAKEISALFVTHAHIDHTGRIPVLIKEGFTGKIYSTPPTKDFSNLLLLDSEHILLQEAERIKKPALYGIREIEEAMIRWETIDYHKEISVGPFKVTFYNAGHILGSSFILIEVEGKRIVFSGDLGNSPAPIIPERESIEEIDYCIIESTYGDRIHNPMNKGIIEDLIEQTYKDKGVLLIPAFALERTQKLLFEINELVENLRVPPVPVYLDSPLALKVTDVYKSYIDYFDDETKELMKKDDSLFDFKGLKKTMTTEESKAINDVPPPKIIIAGSGMSQGGRIMHHEKRYLSDPNNTILFIGYQTKNSLGRRIWEGEKIVKIFGEEITVNCKIVNAEEYSAHADQKQLLEWLSPMRMTLRKVFVVQGDPDAENALLQKTVNDLAIKAEIPEEGKVYDL